MMEPFLRREERWSASLAQRVDQVCDRFEAAWQAGQRPRLIDYLGDALEPEHDLLVCELIALDIAYRQQGGEVPRADDYLALSPALDPAWLDDVCAPSDGRVCPAASFSFG